MRVARWMVLAVALLVPLAGVAQPVVSEPAAELGEVAFQQALKDLGNDLRLLCVAAHPDDEDGATLAYHRFKHGIETHVLICTRGEGGQNEIGPELYEDLAVIRTKEMQDAAKIEGAQLHFLDMPEFGYSKTLEETLQVWGEEELVRRMVRKIREIRPHVIITHHGKMKDHGHHQAVGWALKKAFDLAGDPSYSDVDGSFRPAAEKEKPEELSELSNQYQSKFDDLMKAGAESGTSKEAELKVKFDELWGTLPKVMRAANEGIVTPDAPWQPLRLYIRDFTGEAAEAAVIDITEHDVELGRSYAEIAAEALRVHASQGMEMFIQRLLSPEARAYYVLEKEAAPQDIGRNPVDRYEVTRFPVESNRVPPKAVKMFGKPGWMGKRLRLDEQGAEFEFRVSAGMEQDSTHVRVASGDPRLRAAFEPEEVSDTYGPLFSGLRYNMEYHLPIEGLDGTLLIETIATAASVGFEELMRKPEGSHGEVRARQISELLLEIQRKEVVVTVSDKILVPGQEFEVKLDIHGGEPRIPGLDICAGVGGRRRTPLRAPEHEYTLPEKKHLNRVPPMHDELAPAVTGAHRLFFEDAVVPRLWFEGFRETLPSGDRYRQWDGTKYPVEYHIAPPVLPEFRDGPYLLRRGVASEVSVPVRLTNYTPGAHTQTVTFGAPEGWVVEPASVEMVFAREDEQQVITLAVRAPEGVAPGSYAITADTEKLGFTEEARVAVVDFAPPPGDPLIGIVDSYDVQFRAAMDKMGVRWEAVTEQDFSPERLDRFDVLLVDMRSYLYRPDLKANNAAALAYVERGGTMIVNYHKTFDWAAEFAPHRLVLSNNRVTREDAPVTLREPQHPVWTTPNAIGPADWEGWRQERGLYFAGEWDDAYTPLLETSDPDEVIPPGAMLIADHGEGKYLYTALVWYRQLRELNPGAVRIFANMLAL